LIQKSELHAFDALKPAIALYAITVMHNCVIALTGKASDAVRAITSGITSHGQLEQPFMNRIIYRIWQWLMLNLTSPTMLGVALATR